MPPHFVTVNAYLSSCDRATAVALSLCPLISRPSPYMEHSLVLGTSSKTILSAIWRCTRPLASNASCFSRSDKNALFPSSSSSSDPAARLSSLMYAFAAESHFVSSVSHNSGSRGVQAWYGQHRQCVSQISGSLEIEHILHISGKGQSNVCSGCYLA